MIWRAAASSEKLPRPLARQCIRRDAVALAEIRGRLLKELRGGREARPEFTTADALIEHCLAQPPMAVRHGQRCAGRQRGGHETALSGCTLSRGPGALSHSSNAARPRPNHPRPGITAPRCSEWRRVTLQPGNPTSFGLDVPYGIGCPTCAN